MDGKADYGRDRQHESLAVPSGRLFAVLAATGLFVALAAVGIWLVIGAAGESAVTAGASEYAHGNATAGGNGGNGGNGGEAAVDLLDSRMTRRLHGYGWVDRKAGIVHIPIEEAIDRLTRSETGT